MVIGVYKHAPHQIPHCTSRLTREHKSPRNCKRLHFQRRTLHPHPHCKLQIERERKKNLSLTSIAITVFSLILLLIQLAAFIRGVSTGCARGLFADCIFVVCEMLCAFALILKDHSVRSLWYFYVSVCECVRVRVFTKPALDFELNCQVHVAAGLCRVTQTHTYDHEKQIGIECWAKGV